MFIFLTISTYHPGLCSSHLHDLNLQIREGKGKKQIKSVHRRQYKTAKLYFIFIFDVVNDTASIRIMFD